MGRDVPHHSRRRATRAPVVEGGEKRTARHAVLVLVFSVVSVALVAVGVFVSVTRLPSVAPRPPYQLDQSGRLAPATVTVTLLAPAPR